MQGRREICPLAWMLRGKLKDNSCGTRLTCYAARLLVEVMTFPAEERKTHCLLQFITDEDE